MNLDPIIAATAEAFALPKACLTGGGRARHLAAARFAFYYAVRQATGLSLPTIGLAMGGRDHTSVMHGIARAEDIMRRDPEYAVRVERLIDLCRSSIEQSQFGAASETEQRRRRRVTYYVLTSLERLAVENPAGFDKLMIWAGSHDEAHHH